MTIKELERELKNGKTLDDLFDTVMGDGIAIYVPDFWDGEPTDEIIYICDITYDGLEWDKVYTDDKIKDLLNYCYDGNDFLDCAKGNRKVALFIWKYVNWDNPYSYFMNYLCCSEPEDLAREAGISIEEAKTYFDF